MRHKVFGNQFGRPTDQAKALYRGLVTSVIEKGSINTSRAKAKAVISMLDKAINLGKKGDENAKKNFQKLMGSVNIWSKLLKIIPVLSKSNSGYSRIIKLGERLSDTTEMAVLELIKTEPEKIEEVKVKKIKKKNDDKV